MEIYKNILKKSHLLIVGKTELDRSEFITKLIQVSCYQSFRFPKKMKTFNDYYNFMKKKKLYEPWYEAKSYNEDAIWDFHRDWISENNSLIVLEEIQYMEERWKCEIVRLFIEDIECRKKEEDTIHLIISQDSEDDLVEEMVNGICLQEDERRTKVQIIEQNLKVIDISE